MCDGERQRVTDKDKAIFMQHKLPKLKWDAEIF